MHLAVSSNKQSTISLVSMPSCEEECKIPISGKNEEPFSLCSLRVTITEVKSRSIIASYALAVYYSNSINLPQHLNMPVDLQHPTTIMLCAILSLTILVVSVSGQDEDALAGLAVNIPGLPGQDYPIFAFPPETSFLCDNQIQGYYGDPEADCKLGL